MRHVSVVSPVESSGSQIDSSNVNWTGVTKCELDSPFTSVRRILSSKLLISYMERGPSLPRTSTNVPKKYLEV
jgi:hypothetical protein